MVLIKRISLLTTLLLSFSFCFASIGDTTKIDLFTNLYWNNYKKTDTLVVLPSTTKSYRKIILKYTLGCPSGKNCSGWDYTTRLDALKKNSITKDTSSFEIARLITPYGSYYDSKWKHIWLFDVTHLASVLKDSTHLSALYSGYSDGFTLNAQLQYIEGTNVDSVLQINPLYSSGQGGWGYPNSASFEKNMPEKKGNIPLNTFKNVGLFNISGHGFDNSVLAGEFDSNVYTTVILNNSQSDSQQVWRRNCAFNNLPGQSGTWVYRRANWCPGDRVNPLIFDLNKLISPEKINTINFNLTNYTWTGNQTPSYFIDAQIISYATPKYAYDGGLERIITPSAEDEFQRWNPNCSEIIFIVKNYGSTKMDKVQVQFGLKNGNSYTLEVPCKIDPLMTDTLYISNQGYSWNSNSTKNEFFVKILSVNGNPDQNSENNSYSNYVTAVPDLPSQLYVTLVTNNQPSENRWEVVDYNGKVWASKSTFDKSNTIYNDSFRLPNGCYTFKMHDDGEDGLYFFANPNAGNGNIFLKKVNPNNGKPSTVIKHFNSDFGGGFDYHFTVSGGVGIEENSTMKETPKISPNPTNGIIRIDGLEKYPYQIKLLNLAGSILKSLEMTNEVNNTIDLSNLANGCYLLQIKSINQVINTKVILNR